MHKIELNQQFKTALDLIEKTSESVFVTGKAGTGKSTLLTYLQDVTKKSMVVLAPTGVAALNVLGETIHSFFRFKPNVTVEEAKKAARKVKDNDLYKNIDLIVIDEISMVRADLLDCVDVFLRAVLRKREPFGGIKMVFIGDMYQLPPVLTRQDKEHFDAFYESPYFFSSQVMTHGKLKLHFVELEKIYRQSDQCFIELLNAIRNNSVNDEQLAVLNRRVDPECSKNDRGSIYLTTTNKGADEINSRKLSRLKVKPATFEADVYGDFDLKLAPAPVELNLKAGAQVMFQNNNPEGLWVNGTIGTVKAVDDSEIKVITRDGFLVSVGRYKWTLYKYSFDTKTRTLLQESIGTFTQYPLKLAWAVTIHKSQGKTFNKVIIDLGHGTFAHGQSYVAFSRCQSLDGLILKKPLKKGHVMMDYRVVKFLTRFQYDLSEEKCSTDEKVNIIKEVIKSGERLAITYLKPNDQKSSRNIKPISVGDMEYLGKTYLGMEAWCMTQQSVRVFRVDRILEIKKITK